MKCEGFDSDVPFYDFNLISPIEQRCVHSQCADDVETPAVTDDSMLFVSYRIYVYHHDDNG